MKKSAFTAPILVIVSGLLTVIVRRLLERMTFDSAEELFLTYALAQLFIFVLPGVIYVKTKKRGYTAEMNLVSFGFSKIPFVILMFLVMAAGATLINLFASSGSVGEGLANQAMELSNGDYLSKDRTVLYVILTLAAVPAAAEEFFFRGVLLNEYKEYGMISSVLITSVYFAMLHFDLRLFPYYLLSGIALGLTAFTTRSAFAAALLHCLYNLFSLFAMPFVLNFISLEAGVVVLFLVGVLFLVFVMLALGESERLFAGYSLAALGAKSPRSREKSAFPPFLEVFSPSFLLCAALFVLCALNVISVSAQYF